MASRPERAWRYRGIDYLLRAIVFTYEQVAAISTAVALLALLNRYIHMEWYGVFAHVFGIWDSVIRPLVKDVLDAVLAPLRVLGWHLKVPPLARDYISVGATLFLWKIVGESILEDPALMLWALPIALVVVTLLWPLWFLSLHQEFKQYEDYNSFRDVAPVIFYLPIIFVANAVLMLVGA